MSVVSARSLDEALHALARAPHALVLAGGTDVLVELESGRTRPRAIVDVWKLDALRGIRADASGVRCGALTTCTELLRSPLTPDVLVEAAREVGAVQIQNRATLGGNLGTASPAADLNPVLLALGARVRLVSLRGARELDAAEFLTGYRATARALDELIESVWIPARPTGELRRFRKVGTRRAQSIAKVVVAACVVRDAAGRVTELRAAAGSVAERTLLLPTLERELAGRTLELATVRRAAQRAAELDVRPRDDVRSTADYRRAVLARVLTTLLAAP